MLEKNFLSILSEKAMGNHSASQNIALCREKLKTKRPLLRQSFNEQVLFLEIANVRRTLKKKIFYCNKYS